MDWTAINTQTTTITTELGGSLVFSILEKIPGNPLPTLNVKHVQTITATHTVVFTGISVQDLGNTYFEYCQFYPLLDPNGTPNFFSWLPYNSTGKVNIYLHSPWE
ncbi:MAG: hypothetical protein WAT79_01060 [Saprospiraceae bacterium]